MSIVCYFFEQILFNISFSLSQTTGQYQKKLATPMETRFAEELIAPCGMDCNVCSGYLAKQHDVKNNGIHMSYCAGCRPRDKKCAFLKKRCTRLLNHTVQFCYQCPVYPCEHLNDIDRRYRTLFQMSLLENLTDIKNKGMKTFLRMQEDKWRCPTCGGVICCHNGLCFHCGIERLRLKKNKYRWDDG